MSASNKVSRAAESAAVNLVPFLVVAAVLYVLWRIFESKAGETLGAILGAAGEFAGSQQAGELTDTGPVTAGTLEFLSGEIETPPRNGAAARGLFGSTYPVKFRINNPAAAKNARVSLTAHEYSHWPYDNKTSKWNDVLKLQTGNNSFEVKMPITAGGFKLDVDLRLEVDGELIANTLYTVE